LTICWSTLGFAAVLLLASIVGAFARDIERNELITEDLAHSKESPRK
jgi:hypothetical protein